MVRWCQFRSRAGIPAPELVSMIMKPPPQRERPRSPTIPPFVANHTIATLEPSFQPSRHPGLQQRSCRQGVFQGVGRIVDCERLPGDCRNLSRDDVLFADGTLRILNHRLNTHHHIPEKSPSAAASKQSYSHTRQDSPTPTHDCQATA